MFFLRALESTPCQRSFKKHVRNKYDISPWNNLEIKLISATLPSLHVAEIQSQQFKKDNNELNNHQLHSL